MIEGINSLVLEKNHDNETLIKVIIEEKYNKEIQQNTNEIIIKVTDGKPQDNGNQPKPLLGRKIAIDPGHGGSSSGAVGPSGIMEKNLNLDTSLIIEELLVEQGASVLLTRRRDVTVSLAERTNLANNQKADLFVSIHYNGFSDPNAHGTETYWHTNGSKDSQSLANLLQNELLNKLGRRNRGVKQANFHVLRESKMTSALIEPLFLTNPTEENLMKDPNNVRKVAQAVVDAILKFYS